MATILLTAGPLQMVFDTSTAFLRQVRWGEHEVVRAIFGAVRDRNWDTIGHSIDDLQVSQQDCSFELSFTANSLDPAFPFRWHGRIAGSSEGELTYHFIGNASAPVWKNRIGLCVLHPTRECAGNACIIEHTDGSTSRGMFPAAIAPHQPFKNVRAIRHAIAAGSTSFVTISLSGDTFEMEDQRNWSDASFKTYSTPLELPFPVELDPDTTIEQAVHVRVSGDGGRRHAVDDSSGVVDLEVDWDDIVARPPVGLLLPEFSGDAPRAVVERLRQLAPDHLRIDIHLDEANAEMRLRQAIELCGELGSELEVALFAETLDGDVWNRLDNRLRESGVRVARYLLFHRSNKTTPASLIQSARAKLLGSDMACPVGVGTDAYFAELNREPPQVTDSHLVCFSVNPQVHAFDNLSLRENLEDLATMIDSASLLASSDIALSPVTLRPRFNPNATVSIPRHEQLQAAIDARQSSGFGAAWALGVFARVITHARLHSMTMFEAWGPRGIMTDDGEDTPMTSVFDFVLQSRKVCATRTSQPLHVQVLGGEWKDGKRSLLAANLAEQPVTIWLAGDNREWVLAGESVQFISHPESK